MIILTVVTTDPMYFQSGQLVYILRFPPPYLKASSPGNFRNWRNENTKPRAPSVTTQREEELSKYPSCNRTQIIPLWSVRVFKGKVARKREVEPGSIFTFMCDLLHPGSLHSRNPPSLSTLKLKLRVSLKLDREMAPKSETWREINFY